MQEVILSPAIRITCLVSAGLAAVFAIAGGLAHGFAPRELGLFALAGAVLGAVGAPTVDPQAFRHPARWEVSSGILGAVLLAAALGASLEGFLLAGAFGLVLGYLAPYWIKHIQVP